MSASSFGYDKMGRVVNDNQCTPQICSISAFSTIYTYDLLGDITSASNLDLALTYKYNAGARLITLTNSANDSQHPPTMFSSAHYNGAGSLTSSIFGNTVTETRTYDGRLRLTGISDGSAYSLAIPTNGYAPNSDVLAANDSVNSNWTYGYDAFNRLTASSATGQAYTYGYDRFGNRWKQNVTTGGGPGPSYGFDANNHIVSGSGVAYDAAGNTTNDGVTAYTYDAESRISTAGGTSYVYDAEGRRVGKTVAGGWLGMIYDRAGHVYAQLATNGIPNRWEVYAGSRHLASYVGTLPETYFVYSDWLGTERVRAPYAAGATETCTSLPFGDLLTCTGTDPSPLHFTGKEHDTETGLENFGARYDASIMGRFMSPDPLQISRKKFIDPQQWNMYSYTRNNPLRFVDPTGKSIELTGDDEARKRQLQALQKAAGKAGSYLYDNTDKKTGKHYVGIYTNGPDGKGPSFNSINAVSNKLGGIIQDSRVATVQFVEPGTTKAGQQVGPAPGMSPAVTFAGSNAATIFITRGTLGTFPGTLAADGNSETISLDEVLTHELGHVDSKWFHNGTDTNGDAVRIENQVRQEDGLPMRIGHSEPYDVPLSDMPF